MAWHLLQPRELRIGLGVGEFTALQRVVDPRPALPVLTALVKAGIPHGYANPGNLVGVRRLIRGEPDPKTPTHQHTSSRVSHPAPTILAQAPPSWTGTPCRQRPQRHG